MSTGFTKDQIAQLWRDVAENTPPLPTEIEEKDSPQVAAMRAAATDFGVVVNIGSESGQTISLFFNVVVAKEFAGAVNRASMAYGWHKLGLVPVVSDQVTPPTPDDLALSAQVVSLSTYGTDQGILANVYISQYGESGATMLFYFPRQAAMEFLTYVVQAGETGSWWADDFEIIAADSVN